MSCPPKKPKCSVKKKKSCRGGRKTRNAFFNFLRRFRRKHCGMTITQIAVLGARKWNCMTDQEKCKYIKEARSARPFKRRPKCCPKPRCSIKPRCGPKPKCRPKRKRRSCKKPMKCAPKMKKRCPSKRKKHISACPCPPKKMSCPPKRPVCCPPPKRPVCCPPPKRPTCCPSPTPVCCTE